MFTFNRIVRDEKDEAARRRVVTVEFRNSVGHTKEVTMSFSVNETREVIKRAFKQYLDELNFVPTPITDIVVTDPVPPTPTQAELDRQEWERNRARLKLLMDLVRDGVFTGQETQITNLQTKVRTNVKPEYLG